MSKFTTVSIRRDVLNTARRMAKIEHRPLSTLFELALNARLNTYPAAHRATVTSTEGAP